ncbi:unnamed protein product [Rangifer tarandus platyrhynchus]|uniref:Uncharacterized protein n=1 Tax=Rangifer tarandus platyrhynchus TaxID=3082113 RepID=A0AC59ZQ01_RANTA
MRTRHRGASEMPVPGVGVGGEPSREPLGRPGVLGRGRKPEDQRPGSRGALRHSPAVSVPGPPGSGPGKRPSPCGGPETQPGSWKTLQSGDEWGAAGAEEAEVPCRRFLGLPRGEGTPTTPFLGSPEKLPTWLSASLHQALSSNCGKPSWGGGVVGRAGSPRPPLAPPPGALGQWGRGLEEGRGGRDQSLRDLCVRARDWRERGAHGLGPVGGGGPGSRLCCTPPAGSLP